MLQHLPSIPTECEIPSEVSQTSEIRCVAFNITWNPFSSNSETERIPLKKLVKTVPSSKKKILSKGLVTLQCKTVGKTLLDKIKRADKTSLIGQFSIPAVAFPYIQELSPELMENFRQIHEQIETLPCELSALSVDLLPVPEADIKTLVLGLERTLIQINGSIMVPRPHAQMFLKEASQRFEIVLFSSETRKCVTAALDILDAKKESIAHVLARDDCIQREDGVFIKDLRIIKNRKLENIVVVDSTIISFMEQLDNTIHIPSFEGSKEDQELLNIFEFLTTLQALSDVRPMVKKFSGISRLMKIYTNEIINAKKEPAEDASEPYVGSEFE